MSHVDSNFYQHRSSSPLTAPERPMQPSQDLDRFMQGGSAPPGVTLSRNYGVGAPMHARNAGAASRADSGMPSLHAFGGAGHAAMRPTHQDDFYVPYSASAPMPSFVPPSSSAVPTQGSDQGASEADIRSVITPELEQIASTIRVSQRSRLPPEAVKIMRAWLVLHDSSPYPDASAKRVFAHVTGLSIDQVTTWFANQRKRHWFPKKRRALLDRGIAAGAGSGNAVAAATAAVESGTQPSDFGNGHLVGHQSQGYPTNAFFHSPGVPMAQNVRPLGFVPASSHPARQPIGFQQGAMPGRVPNSSQGMLSMQQQQQGHISAAGAHPGVRGRYYSAAEMHSDAALLEDRRLAVLAQAASVAQPGTQRAANTISTQSYVSDDHDFAGRPQQHAQTQQVAFPSPSPWQNAGSGATQRTRSMPEEIGARARAWRGDAQSEHAATDYALPFSRGMSAAGWLVHQRSRSLEASQQQRATSSLQPGHESNRISSNEVSGGAAGVDADEDIVLESPSGQGAYTDAFPPSSGAAQWAAPLSAAASSSVGGASGGVFPDPTASASSRYSALSMSRGSSVHGVGTFGGGSQLVSSALPSLGPAQQSAAPASLGLRQQQGHDRMAGEKQQAVQQRIVL